MRSKKNGNKIFARIDRGEEVLDKLQELREEYGIKNGFFFGIGAVSKVTLGNYNPKNQKYIEEEFGGKFEVSNFSGNIGPDKIHAHITVADDSFDAKAGHCSRAKVSGTFEIIIDVSEKPVLEHKYDSETGLDVFDL